MSTERNPKWNKSLSFPIQSTLSQPFMVNNDEFVVVASWKIYKFNTQKNEWTKIFDYHKNFECDVDSPAYDNKHKLLYMRDTSEYPGQMLIFDLQTKNKVTSKKEQCGRYFALIFVQNRLHKICSRNGDHYIYDKTKQFKKITTFKSLDDMYGSGLIYLQSSKSILLFGGYSSIGPQ
eukprot:239438_1